MNTAMMSRPGQTEGCNIHCFRGETFELDRDLGNLGFCPQVGEVWSHNRWGLDMGSGHRGTTLLGDFC